MGGKGQGNLKPLIMILMLTIILLVITFVITPMITDKSESMAKKVNAGEEKLRVLQEKEETYLFKIAAEGSKQTTKKEKEVELQEKEAELGININRRYLESNNTNIFFLFSSIADTLDMSVSELSIHEAEIFIPLEEGEEPPVVEEPEDEDLEDGAVITNVPTIPEGFKPVQAKQVSLSLYGDYIDIMLYFQMLNRFSDNFELVSLDVSPLVLANGVPASDYELSPNEYGFILGNTMNTMNKLDIFYYESKLAENFRLAEEKAKKEAQALEEQKAVKNDKFTSLTSRYSASKSEVTKLARYYGASDKYNVPVPYILATVDVESGFDAGAVGINDNGTKDRGLMQLNSGTAPQLMRILGIEYVEGMEHIPALNIELGTMYLSTIAQSRGIDLSNATDIEKHYVFTAYNMGVTGAEEYALKNKSYSVTPYESAYSRKAIQKLNDYILYEDKGEIEPVSYTKDIIEYKEEVAKINQSSYNKDDEIEIKEFREVTAVKVLFTVKDTGPDTLLLENINFNFDTPNTKKSPVSLEVLSESDIKDVGNNGVGNGLGVNIQDETQLRLEVNRAKYIVRNRLAQGLPIDRQLEYIERLTVNGMEK